MAIQKITEGLTGAEAAQLIFDNDNEANELRNHVAGTAYLANQKAVGSDGILYRVKPNVVSTLQVPSLTASDWQPVGGGMADSELRQNTLNPVNSEAVLSKFFHRNGQDFTVHQPARVIPNARFINGAVNENPDYDIYYFLVMRDMVFSNNLPAAADASARAVHFFNGTFDYANRRIDNFFTPGAQTVRKLLTVEEVKALSVNIVFAGVSIHKSFTGNVCEFETKYEPFIKDELFKNYVGFSELPILKIYPNTIVNTGGNVVADANHNTIVVPFENDILFNYKAPTPMMLQYMSESLSMIGQGNLTNQLGGTEVKDYLLVRAGRDVRIKYLRFSVKNTDSTFSFKSDLAGTGRPFTKNFNQKDVLLRWQGETHGDKALTPQGNLVDEVGSLTYFINTHSLQDAVLTVRLSPEHSNMVFLSHDKKRLYSEDIGTNAVSYDMSKLGVGYVGFTLRNAFSSNYFRLDGARRPETDSISAVYNLIDYIDFGAPSGFMGVSGYLQNLVNLVADNGGGTIFVPAGRYQIFASVTWRSGVNLVGEGSNLTIFEILGSQSAFIGSNISNFTYSDFQIDGILQKRNSGSDAYMKGIFQTYLIDVTYKNLIIKNTGATGLGCDFFQSGVVHNVRAFNCGRLVRLTLAHAPGASGIGIGTGSFDRGMEGLIISDCHAHGCGQYGIFVEIQSGDRPTGTTVVGCTAEGNRTGFGVSGSDSTAFIGCHAFNNHHAGFAYDTGTMGSGSTTGLRPKYIGCSAKENGRNIPDGYPEYLGQKNGYGWYILGSYDGIELTSCNSFGNLKSGLIAVDGAQNMYINGGSFFENGEDGIEINGRVDKFKISPSVVENNVRDGISLNGEITNGFIKDSVITHNTNGINRKGGTLDNVIIKDNLVYQNSVNDLVGVTQS